MAEITQLSRIVDGINRNIKLKNTTLGVQSVKFYLNDSDSSGIELTKSIVSTLISGTADAGSLHNHDGRYSTKTDLASTANAKGASLIGIEDSGAYYSATTVEAALAEGMLASQAAQSAASTAQTAANAAQSTANTALSNISDHILDTEDAHDASSISLTDAVEQYAATNVEDALTEVMDAAQNAHSAAAAAQMTADAAVAAAAAAQADATQALANASGAQTDIDNLVTLSGVAANSTDLGTFNGSTIPDSSTIKGALQSLETAAENTLSLIQNFEWQNSVKDRLATPPASPSTGDRYLVIATATGDWAGQENNIAEWNGSAWVFTSPSLGMYVGVDQENDGLYLFGGTSWTKKYFEATTASTGLTKSGFDVRIADANQNGLNVTSGVFTVNVDGTSIERGTGTGHPLKIKFGTSGQVAVAAGDLSSPNAGLGADLIGISDTQFASSFVGPALTEAMDAAQAAQADATTALGNIAAHMIDQMDAHIAAAIGYDGTNGINSAAGNVQEAIFGLDEALGNISSSGMTNYTMTIGNGEEGIVANHLNAIDTALGLRPLSTDLASTANAKGASLIGIEDAGSNFTATTVEAALAEVADRVDVLEDGVRAVDLYFVNGEGFQINAGSVVIVSQGVAGEILIANANAFATCEGVIGVAMENIASAASGKVRICGEATVIPEASLPLGKRVYVSPANSGFVTDVAPTDTDTVQYLMGISTATNKIVLNMKLEAINE